VGEFTFSVPTSPTNQGFAKIAATLSNIADHDCAFDSQTVQLGYTFNSWRCGCQLSGVIQFPHTGGCVATCNGGNRRRSILGTGVNGLRVRAYVSVTYRRQKQSGHNDDDEVSPCGPLLTLSVDSKKVWTNSAQGEFGSEGVVSGHVEFLAPFDQDLQFVLDIKMNKCRGYSVSVWDPHFSVESSSGSLTVDSTSPVQVLE